MSQQPAAQAAPAAYPPDMIRPERIAGIPMLSAEKKAFYTEGLTKLWAALDTNPRGSENYIKAVSKIKDVSREIMRQVANWKATQGQQQQQQQQQQQRPQSQGQQPQLPNQQPPQPQPQSQQPAQQAAAPVQPQPSQPAQPPQSAQQHQQPQHPSQQPQSLPQAQPPAQLGQQAKTFLNNFKVFPPTNIIPNTPEYENYKRRIMHTLTQLVTMQETSVARFQNFHEKITAMESSGQTPQPEFIQARDSAKSGVQNAKTKIDSFRNENERNRLAWAEKTKQPPQNNQQPSVAPNTTPYNPQHAAANPNGQPMSPAVPNTYQTTPVAMHSQQPIARPPAPPQPYQSPATQGPPQPLSHSAAISQAQRSYSEAQGQNTPTPGGQPFNHAQNTALNVGNPKFPIPKQLPPQTHNPVPLGPARPTFGGPSNGAPGMMGQPAVQKTPHFILEGEGDRVLSKKKLDELVRQVTGGGEGDSLTPDVEEAVLSLADDFVDNVITAACRLAKIRPNSTLDIRDIQIILERNYNIRVPGYSLDEVRTVRKFQPAAGWTQKMNAVQAAKVMGKNDS